ncbi:uncharacterized protein LOC6048497 [Culex quinquefasciatus]|uniref:uncharacterized protein LOC6048497 n=1 Tax=Culex quinquefasciatus TaxID=7176 RepID=UPI0018E36C9D|nr:uncharacterized protein LOC6048497 [Culex quinquefasciatus]
MQYLSIVFMSLFAIDLSSANGVAVSKIDEIFVGKCEKNIKTKVPAQLCQIRKLLIDVATAETKAFGDCILKEFGYFDSNGKIDKSALAKDYSEQGFIGKDAELSSMIDDCEREFGTGINSVNYLLCITMEKDFAGVLNSRKKKEGKWQPEKPVCK